MAVRRKFAKRRVVRGRKRAPKKGGRASMIAARRGVKAMVKREIAKATENKTMQVYDHGFDIKSFAAADFDSRILPMGPDATGLIISQGTNQQQRIGNKIKLKKLVFSGILHPLPYDATTNPTPAPCFVKMFFFYNKEDGNAVPTPKAAGDFFQFGGSTTTFQNDLSDLVSPINTDKYRVLATRTMKIGYQAYTGTGALPQQGNMSNNDFKLCQRFRVDLTKLHPQNVQFRDSATGPTTRNVYMMAVPIYANGTTIGSGIIPARMSFIQDLQYEDA